MQSSHTQTAATAQIPLKFQAGSANQVQVTKFVMVINEQMRVIGEQLVQALRKQGLPGSLKIVGATLNLIIGSGTVAAAHEAHDAVDAVDAAPVASNILIIAAASEVRAASTALAQVFAGWHSTPGLIATAPVYAGGAITLRVNLTP
ncbi:hypothetical protein [Burkholderia perseverans]|uniref:hypothetical protein n=1 Tax=Burkholderia perseverans TaxID=2615214 RepID=UPI001FEEF5CE|nr:hypothetical protein [Burkholderia perseverans]